MERLKQRAVLFAAMFLIISFASAQTPGYNTDIPENILTPSHVKTSFGEFDFYDGMPTAETTQKVYDKLDFLRSVDVFLNFLPAASLEAMRKGLASVGADVGNKILIFDKLMDSTPLFLTGNTSTVYATAVIDLEKFGPTVVEIPAGAGPGTVNDAFFRFVVDMGAPGPDRKKGGTYILLPPDYTGELKPTPNTFQDNSSVRVKINGEEKDVWIARSLSYINWLILRGFMVDGKPEPAAEMWRSGLKVYPLAEASNPPEMTFINISGKFFNTIHPNTIDFYKEIWDVLQKEPLGFIDPELRGQAGAIGIAKGDPYNPDDRMRKIMTDAVAFANAAARAISLRPRDKRAKIFEDRQWYSGFVGEDYRWLGGDGRRGRDLDSRILFFYLATVNTPAMVLKIPGVGSNYAMATLDKDGNILKGSETYRLHVTANVPAKDFWSVVVYDPQTRSMLQTGQPFPSINNQRNKLKYNKDGSVDLYFGPEPPEGKKSNWIQTVPDKAWFAIFRLYGPLKPWFEKTWKLNDFEKISEKP